MVRIPVPKNTVQTKHITSFMLKILNLSCAPFKEFQYTNSVKTTVNIRAIPHYVRTAKKSNSEIIY